MSVRQFPRRIAAVAAAAACLLAGVAAASEIPGETFLLIWPTARSTALAGAMTGLADDPDAAYWNPGGLAFQDGLGACVSSGTWLPDFWSYPHMRYTYASAGFGRAGLLPGWRTPLNVGVDLAYFNTGETDLVDEHGNFIGRFTCYEMALGLHAGARVARTLGVGMSIKYIRSGPRPEWLWWPMPELGLDGRGTGSDVAVDFGMLYRPRPVLSLGLALANLGPRISYVETGESAPLPSVLRVGACVTPVDNPHVRVRALLEFDKILVGFFEDTTGTKTFGRKMNEELQETWKSVAVEATFLQVFAARVGYFEDLAWQRGGFVMEKEGQTHHYGLWDVLTREKLGTLERTGICWGLAFCYKDHARLELSDDSNIWDFPTGNTKIGLTVNDVGGMLEDLKSGRPFDWMP